jgi:hypothetical protein
MSAPIFADPILDGAADPTVIWNASAKQWWMFYTVRRPKVDSPRAEWIHGCPIGVAVSEDGKTWTYRGTVDGLDDPDDTGLNTHWAPEVIWGLDEYHMYLTYISGVPDSWDSVRKITHFVSDDLVAWRRIGPIVLSSNNTIDAAVAYCPDGLFRLWYKDEADGSSTWVATSIDLYDWTLDERVIPGKPMGDPHEGPNVFALGGWYWMIVDEWRGLAVYRSTDCTSWMRQGLILSQPGRDPDDTSYARHADVVVQGDWAAVFYFTHPGWREKETPEPKTYAERRTTIHVARAWVEEGVLHCDRDAEDLRLEAPVG